MAKLSLGLARAFQAEALAALQAGDLDRAGKAETRFSHVALCIRRAVGLKARLREHAPAAPPGSDEALLLSGLAELSFALAQAFQVEALAALGAGDLDRAGKAETRFSRLALGIRRAIALKARLREQREAARRVDAQGREARQAEIDDRRRQVAQGVTRAIAAATPQAETPDTADAEAREKLTAALWARLAGDHPDRIDADLADTLVPVDALIRSMCRALGIAPDRAAITAAIAGAEADRAAGRDWVPRRASRSGGRRRSADAKIVRHRRVGRTDRPIPAAPVRPDPHSLTPPLRRSIRGCHLGGEALAAEIHRRKAVAWSPLRLAARVRRQG